MVVKYSKTRRETKQEEPKPYIGQRVMYEDHGRFTIHATRKAGRIVDLKNSRGEVITGIRFREVTPLVKPEPIAYENIDEVPWVRLREEVLYQDGAWVRMCRYFALVMTARECRMMDFLINWQKTCGRGKKSFYCLTNDIAREAFIPPTTQPSVFASLRRKRYISTKMGGQPAKRWIVINYAKLCKDMFAAHDEWMREYEEISPFPEEDEEE